MRATGARFTSAVRQDIPAVNVPCTDRRDPPLHRKNDTSRGMCTDIIAAPGSVGVEPRISGQGRPQSDLGGIHSATYEVRRARACVRNTLMCRMTTAARAC